MRQEGKERQGLTPMVDAVAQGWVAPGLPSPLLPCVDTLMLQHSPVLTDPVDVTALIWWPAAMQSQREEEGRDLSVCMCLSWDVCVCRGWREQKGDRLFSGVPSDSNGHKLKYWKLNRFFYFLFFTLMVLKLLYRPSWEAAFLQALKAQLILILLWVGGWTGQPPGIPSSLSCSVTLRPGHFTNAADTF